MVEIITDPITTNRALAAYGVGAIPSSTSEVLRATAGQAYDTSITPLIGRSLEREGQFRVQSEDPAQALTPEQEAFQEGNADSTRGYVEKKYRLLDAEEANAEYGIKGHLSFDSAVPEPTARQLNSLKRDELYRQSVFQRAEGGVGQFLGKLGTGFLVSAADPLNIASAFIPVVGEARYASWLAKAGSAAGRAQIRVGVGAAEGAVGTAALEPFTYTMARSEQQDYNATDSLLNIAFGTVLGGGLHAAAGAIGDKITGRFSKEIEAATPETREAALRTAVSQVADGRPVDVGPILNTHLPRVPMRDVDPADIAGSVRAFVEEAAQPGTRSSLLRFGTVDDVVADKISALGVDVRGFDHVIQTDDLRHAMRRHGGDVPKNQVALTAEDIARIPEILATGEARIGSPTHDRDGSAMIQFVKREADGTTFVVEQARAGKRRLAFKTMYRLKRGGAKPGTSDAALAGPSRHTAEPIPGGAGRTIARDADNHNPAAATDDAPTVQDMQAAVRSLVDSDRNRFLDPAERASAAEIERRSAEIPRAPETVADAEKALQVEEDRLQALEQAGHLTDEDKAYLQEADEMVKNAEAHGRAAEAGASCLSRERD